jgi:biotin synthase
MVTFQAAKKIFEKPFFDLIHKAHCIHKKYHNPNLMQLSTLLSIQTGACYEDCAYCAQSIHNNTKWPQKTVITDIDVVVETAKRAKKIGASRFCMGTSGRSPEPEIFEIILKAVKAVKKLGLETCVTSGMLNEEQVIALKECGLDYYNHNVDTSPEYYNKITTTRTMEDRVKTIHLLQKHGVKVCSGGILGMGETNDDRINMLVLLANLPEPLACLSINRLVKIPGARLGDVPDIDPFDFVRCMALCRILMPKSIVRVSAGRESMSDELQALCFFAGVNAFFIGEKLLTTQNADFNEDLKLLKRLNLEYIKVA